ncbi:MAG: hypothetical protein ACM3YE_09370 [Bacteroidota bacterium]
MKKIILLSLLSILFVGGNCWAGDFPVRYGTEVKNVFEPINTNGDLVISDETIDVDLHFMM